MEYYILNYTKSAIGESGESCKSNYTFENACEVCGTGAKLVGKLRTRGLAKVKKDFFSTLDDDFIISKKMYEELKDKLQLGNLKTVVDSKSNDLPFYHLNTDLHFPAGIKKDGLVIYEQCLACKRNGYFNKTIVGNSKMNIPTQVFPIGLYYPIIENKFLNSSDFFFTWESMGLSNRIAQGNNVIRYARPLLIISERFKTALVSYKIKGLDFEPIIIASDATHLV